MSNFTVMAWINLASVSYWSRIFDFGNDTSTYLFLTPRNGFDYTARFGISASGALGEQDINGSVALGIGDWHQVAVTINSGKGILYLDGVAVGTNSNLSINPASLGSTANNYIGRSQSGSEPYLDGSVDEFRIYDTGLSAAEIEATAVLGPGQLLSTGRPQINITATSADITLRWPLASAGFTVQSRTNLAEGDWANITSPAPQIVGDQWQVTFPATPGALSKFYRLVK